MKLPILQLVLNQAIVLCAKQLDPNELLVVVNLEMFMVSVASLANMHSKTPYRASLFLLRSEALLLKLHSN